MYLKQLFALIGTILSFAAGVQAEERCTAEVKLLLPSPSIQTAISSLGFDHERIGRVYLFDTDARDLLAQGVLLRVRQGAKNDLTVKLRLTNSNQPADKSRLFQRFPCEIDRTPAATYTSFAAQRRYRAAKLPESGSDIHELLNDSQIQLLHEAQISIDWARVRRVADIKSTTWESTAQAAIGKLALELWEWPAGKILEVSARGRSDGAASRYAELERLVTGNSLTLSANQDNKTSRVLETLAEQTVPPK